MGCISKCYHYAKLVIESICEYVSHPPPPPQDEFMVVSQVVSLYEIATFVQAIILVPIISSTLSLKSDIVLAVCVPV